MHRYGVQGRNECPSRVCVTGNNKVIAPVKGSEMNLARAASPFIGSLCRCIRSDINSTRVCTGATTVSRRLSHTIIAAAKWSRSIQGRFSRSPFSRCNGSAQFEKHCTLQYQFKRRYTEKIFYRQLF